MGLNKPWRVVYDHRTQLVYVGKDENHTPADGDREAVIKWAQGVCTSDFLYSQSWLHVDVPNGDMPDGSDYELQAVVVVVQFGGPMPSPERKQAWAEWSAKHKAEGDLLRVERVDLHVGFADEIEQPHWLMALMHDLGVII